MRAAAARPNGATVGHFLAVRGLLALVGLIAGVVFLPGAPGGHTCPLSAGYFGLFWPILGGAGKSSSWLPKLRHPHFWSAIVPSTRWAVKRPVGTMRLLPRVHFKNLK